MEQYESKVRANFNEELTCYDLPTGQNELDYDILIEYITKHKPKCIV